MRYAALDGVAFCARIGLLEAEVTMAWKTHFARNTPQRYEMCNWFFVGQVESRDPDQLMSPDEVRPLRHEAVTHDLARHLHQHCTEEMSCLSEFLRVPYRQVTQDQTL